MTEKRDPTEKPPSPMAGPEGMTALFASLAEKIDPAQLKEIAGFASKINAMKEDVVQLDKNIRFLNQKVNLILDHLKIERPKAP